MYEMDQNWLGQRTSAGTQKSTKQLASTFYVP